MTERGARGGRRIAARRVPLFLALPALAAAVAVLLPVAYLIVRAAGASGEAWAILDLRTARLVLDTMLLVAAVVAASIVISVPLAWLVVRTDLPLRAFWGVAVALPLVIPSYVAALALLGALGPRGLLQGALEGPFGVERLPEIYGFPGALIALTLSTYPYVYLLVTAGLRDLDPALEDAARALGRPPWRVFLSVTLPGLRPSIAAGGLLVALYTLADFGAVSLMQYPALTRAVYLQYQGLFDRDPAAVLGLVLVVLTFAVLLAESWARTRARLHRSAPGSSRQPGRVRLERWRWAGLAYCGGVVLLFLALPIGVLVHWAWQGISLGRPVDLLWQAALNSVLASSLAAAVAVVAAVPVAVLAQRHRRAWTVAIERLCFAGNALPGIVIALSLVFFAARYGWLYQTLALLVFAYVVRFLPEAVAATGAALRLVDPKIEEAARGLGRRDLGVLVRVTVPLARSGVLVGGALVFLSVMKELPATLLLRPIGFETLATEIWQETNVAAYSDAAPAALLLILVSAPFVYLLAARRGSDVSAPG
jgi:iron(III) transport system permease protein